jgi:hypothetical protein
MIKIVITQTTTMDVGATKSFLVSETATGKQDSYSSPVFDKKYEVRDYVEQKTTDTQLLSQAILNDSDFDLAAVIVAINKKLGGRK